MSTYVTSDIHGELSKFKEMLKIIKFSNEDKLYIIGDAIDRGDFGIEVLQIIMNMQNCTFILGNHEQMMLEAYSEENIGKPRYFWLQNGGLGTCHGFLRLKEIEQNNILTRLKSSPLYTTVDMNGKSFYLVHGKPDENDDNKLWARVRKSDDFSELIDDKIVIFGHTPSWHYHKKISTNGGVLIWHAHNKICLDCGCGHENPMSRLACLRLDDMREFYV